MQRSWLPLVLLFTTTVMSPLEAQTASQPPDSFLVEVSASIGELDCEFCGAGEDGSGFGASVAWRVHSHAFLGVALTFFSVPFERFGTTCLFPIGCGESRSSGTDGIATLVPILRVHPVRGIGLFVHGGIGLGLVKVNDPDVFADFGPDLGIGTSVGLGFEVGPPTGFALTPRVIRSQVVSSGRSTSVVEVGLALTYR